MAEYSLQFVIDVVNKGQTAFKEVEKSLAGMKGKLEDMQPAFKKMALIGGATFGAISLAVKQSLDAYKESEAELTKADTMLKTLSNTALKTLGGSFESAQQKVREFGNRLQAMGGIADEAGAVGVAKLTQITGDFEKAQKAALVAADLAKYKNIDYASAVEIVGKVLNGNTAILQRYGIEIDKNASAEQAMAELAKRVAGQYEAYGKTLEGQTEILKQRFGDLKESIGKALVPILTDLLQKISPIIEKFIAWAEANPELLKKIILVVGGVSALIAAVGTLGLILPSLIGGFQALGTTIAFLVSNPIGWIILAIITVGGYILWLIKNQERLRENLAAVVEAMKIYWHVFVQDIQTALIKVKTLFAEIFNWIKEHVLQPFIETANRVISLFQRVIDMAKAVGSAVGSAVSKTFGGKQFGGEIPRTGWYMLHKGEYVNPAGKVGSIVVNINGGYYLSEDVAEEIGDMIIEKLRRIIKL